MFSTDHDDEPAAFSLAGASMKAVSPEIDQIARKNCTAILGRLGEVGQNTVANGLGINESNISEWKKKGEFERMAKVLALLGLKAVPLTQEVVDMEEVSALLTLSKARVATLTPQMLVKGD